MKVSIIVPVYNGQDYLRVCVDSILAQTYDDYEVILVDDGSTDRSSAICDDYHSQSERVRVVHQPNCGLPMARQVGIGNAQGEYVLFVDADDWIDPNHLESLVTQAEQEQADIVMCGFWFEFPRKQVKFANIPKSLEGRDIIVDSLTGILHAGVVFKLLRRSMFVDHQIRFPKHIYLEDMYLTVELLLAANRTTSTRQATYHYRFNNQSQTHVRDAAYRIRKYNEAIQNLQDLFDGQSLWNDEALRMALFHRINYEKLELLTLPYSEGRGIKQAYESYADSWKAYQVGYNPFRLPNYMALRYRRLLVAQLIMHIRLLARKILKGT